MTTTLLLARHGETDSNRERRWQGQRQTPLNETGRSQARQLGRGLASDPPLAIYCSDLDRARETAELVAAELGLTARLDPRLREVDVGDLAGLLVAELPGDWTRPIDYLLAHRPDLFDAMRRRVVAALREIAAGHEHGRVLVVTHGGPIAAAWFASGGSPADRPSVGNCHVLPIRIEDGVIARID
jgi:broad specificity phosphatase PhoE